jgi:hypothetical protein
MDDMMNAVAVVKEHHIVQIYKQMAVVQVLLAVLVKSIVPVIPTENVQKKHAVREKSKKSMRKKYVVLMIMQHYIVSHTILIESVHLMHVVQIR